MSDKLFNIVHDIITKKFGSKLGKISLEKVKGLAKDTEVVVAGNRGIKLTLMPLELVDGITVKVLISFPFFGGIVKDRNLLLTRIIETFGLKGFYITDLGLCVDVPLSDDKPIEVHCPPDDWGNARLCYISQSEAEVFAKGHLPVY